MKKFIVVLLLVLFGITASSQDYDIKVNRVCFFTYPANITNVDYLLIDSVKFNETFVNFATIKIDLKNNIIICGEVNGLKTKTTVFDIISVNDDYWSTLDITGKNKQDIIRFRIIDRMLVVSHIENNTVYGWFDRFAVVK